MLKRGWVILLACAISACASAPETNSRYGATESILEVVSVLRLHIGDDTYRFPPARDFTGKNVYRTTLNRLESLEQIHDKKFSSGYLIDVILFAKARALERLAEFEVAGQYYKRVTDLDSPLRAAARIGEQVCKHLNNAAAMQPESGIDPSRAMALYDKRRALLEKLVTEVKDTHYEIVALEELERADRERAEHFGARARLDSWLEIVALQQYQHLVQRHKLSKFRNRHLLDLGDLYAALSREYVQRNRPSSLTFDPATFDEYSFGATRLYESVTQQDGAIEKIEASRKLEAYLAFTLQVHDEKLPR